MNWVSVDLLANHIIELRINQEFPWTLLNWVTYDLSTESVINTSCLDEGHSVGWIRGTVIANMYMRNQASLLELAAEVYCGYQSS